MKTVKKLIAGLIVIVIYLGSVFLGEKVFARGTEKAGKIEYSLAYPGILPDSPIYFLKVVRDHVVLWLAKEPTQKAFYLLLLSDKRLAAGEMLINRDRRNSSDSSVGAVSIVRGEQYFNQAVDQAIVAKKNGADTSDLFAKLTVSSAKHREIIDNLLTKASGKNSEQLTKARRDNQNSAERVREIFFLSVGMGK